MADKPTRFPTENMPKGTSIIISKVSSSRRRYVPMGFISENEFASDLVFLIPNANLYHFGVLTSNVHMAWMRAVCGRLGNGYRYSKDIVYNNFPWPDATEAQRQRIAKTAQRILDVRNDFPDCSLADLYDPVTMPPALLEAHRDNDRAVLDAYAFPVSITEPQCVAALFTRYRSLLIS